jgi:two-component system chemotaxis response regulator CheY
MKSCLIVDDSKVVRKVARRIIEELGFTCQEAEDGAHARDLCAKDMPDAIFLDWNMPVMNGMEFLGHLRKMKDGKKPKVVFCSTENSAEKLRHAMKAGADEFIMKPFDAETIGLKFKQVGL